MRLFRLPFVATLAILACVVLAVALSASPALAATGAPAAVIDLSPIVSVLVQIAALVLTAIVGWLATRLAAYFHVSAQSQLLQNVLGAVDRGISYGQNVVATKLSGADKIAVNNAVAAEAVNYVVTKIPDTLNRLGMTPQHVADLVTAKLPPAAATPAA